MKDGWPMGFKQRVEDNPTIWLLRFVVAGFLAGLATYQGALEFANLEVVPKSEFPRAAKELIETLTEEKERLQAEVRILSRKNQALDLKFSEADGGRAVAEAWLSDCRSEIEDLKRENEQHREIAERHEGEDPEAGVDEESGPVLGIVRIDCKRGAYSNGDFIQCYGLLESSRDGVVVELHQRSRLITGGGLEVAASDFGLGRSRSPYPRPRALGPLDVKDYSHLFTANTPVAFYANFPVRRLDGENMIRLLEIVYKLGGRIRRLEVKDVALIDP